MLRRAPTPKPAPIRSPPGRPGALERGYHRSGDVISSAASSATRARAGAGGPPRSSRRRGAGTGAGGGHPSWRHHGFTGGSRPRCLADGRRSAGRSTAPATVGHAHVPPLRSFAVTEFSLCEAEPRLGSGAAGRRRSLPLSSGPLLMRQHRDVTDRHGIVWNCELLRLRLVAGVHPDVRPRAHVHCAGAGESFGLDLLAVDWNEMTDEQLLAAIEHEAAARLAHR